MSESQFVVKVDRLRLKALVGEVVGVRFAALGPDGKIVVREAKPGEKIHGILGSVANPLEPVSIVTQVVQDR